MSPIDQQLLVASGKLLPISAAAKYTPYSAEYLSLLARKGRLKAVKISRDWLTTAQAVEEYTSRQVKKHEKMIVSFQRMQAGGYPRVVAPRACVYNRTNKDKGLSKGRRIA